MKMESELEVLGHTQFHQRLANGTRIAAVTLIEMYREPLVLDSMITLLFLFFFLISYYHIITGKEIFFVSSSFSHKL